MYLRTTIVAIICTLALPVSAQKPDFSDLPAEVVTGIENACLSTYYSGPAIHWQCLRDQAAKYRSSAGVVDLSRVDPEVADAAKNGCLSTYYSGPVTYNDCIRRQLNDFARTPGKPNLSRLPYDVQTHIKNACLSTYYSGPAAYYTCIRIQAQSVASAVPTEPLRQPPAVVAPQAAPPTKQPKTKPEAEKQARPSPRPDDRPRKERSTPITPEEVYAIASPSVYLVIAVDSVEDFQKGAATQGSAVAVGANRALTNCHVVDKHKFIALIDDGPPRDVLMAKIVTADAKTDRCILSTTEKLRPLANFRSHAGLKVGERVYTIGNPSGLTKTLGEGLISGLRVHDGIRYVQTTAPISPGSSGGALLDAKGNLVGITTFLLKETQNLNFAISAEEYEKLTLSR